MRIFRRKQGVLDYVANLSDSDKTYKNNILFLRSPHGDTGP